ncbi:dual specificity protein phosphatase 10 [Amblyraja radiata]|uniref:dual specificity protein phosphatase 10 n=1 Tax=Amblyraja radiata TaxID=386614 RepID=UPI00140382BD|nr:dual specificity protein phosphatase 10 [Amblyraja radiata]XP_032881179.1 dual specificity protein phosphatase 10 [Amblyraja radiata]
MPPSPLDERIVGVVALPRPVRPQELHLRLDSTYVASLPATTAPAACKPQTQSTILSPEAGVSFRSVNFTYMPSSNGSVRSLSCGCSSASCCTVTTYDNKGNGCDQTLGSAGSSNLVPASASKLGTSANCASCASNQMVSNSSSSNENGATLNPPPSSASAAGLGGLLSPPLSGSTKHIAGVRTIYPTELAKKLTKCSKGPQSQSQGPVIIDCRPFMEYNKSHIQGAVHINCSDKISRRRLQQGKITVLDLISCREGKDSYKRIFAKEIIVYDENTNEPNRVMPSQPLHIVLESLKREGKDPLVLKGGHSSFKQHHENLCDHSLQLQECPAAGGASAIPTQLPQSIPTTPDIENAELTPILPFLFLGNEQDAQDIEKMQQMNIGYIINVTTHLPLYHYEKGIFHYKRLPATDSNKQNLRQYFEEAFEFIEEAHQCGKGLLIHCQAGVSRSATIVIAYLMKHTRMTMTDAYKFVKGKRLIISPNLNFMGQLLEFEEDLNNGVTPRILTPKLIGVETVV